MKNNQKNEKYVLSIVADWARKTLYIPKAIKEGSRILTRPEAAMYFEYKNRYPSFSETIV